MVSKQSYRVELTFLNCTKCSRTVDTTGDTRLREVTVKVGVAEGVMWALETFLEVKISFGIECFKPSCE